jgi:hypothetical protein
VDILRPHQPCESNGGIRQTTAGCARKRKMNSIIKYPKRFHVDAQILVYWLMFCRAPGRKTDPGEPVDLGEIGCVRLNDQDYNETFRTRYAKGFNRMIRRREFLKLAIGTVACTAAPVAFGLVVRKSDYPTADKINELLYFRGLRPCPHSHHSSDEEFAECRLTRRVCRSCGRDTGVHLIDTTRSLHSPERARTVCFSCVPEARVIEQYYSDYATRMAASVGKRKCSECGVGPGWILPLPIKDIDYRLCSHCAPEGIDCRRWVRDLRGTA